MHVSKRYARPAQVGQEWKTYLKNGSLSGECEVHGVEIVQDKIETHYAKWTFNSSNETTIRLPVFFFPAWRLTSNDVPLRTDYDLETGLIKISLKPGINEIALDWNMLVMERAGWLLTITSTAFLIAFTVTEKRTAKSS